MEKDNDGCPVLSYCNGNNQIEQATADDCNRNIFFPIFGSDKESKLTITSFFNNMAKVLLVTRLCWRLTDGDSLNHPSPTSMKP